MIFLYLHFSIVRAAGWPQAGSPVSVSIKIFRWVGKKIKDHLWTGLKTYRVVQKIVSDFHFKSIIIIYMYKNNVEKSWQWILLLYQYLIIIITLQFMIDFMLYWLTYFLVNFLLGVPCSLILCNRICQLEDDLMRPYQ